jgi:hypothetical protein
MLRVMRSAVPRKRPSIGNRNSPRNGCDLPPLGVIRNKLHFRRVTLDIDIVIACTDAAVAQLLALYDAIRNGSNDWDGRTINARALQKKGIFTNGCGDPAIVLPTARPILPAT